MSLDLRSFAIATAGFCAFVNLYSPQALLPELAGEFNVGPGEISTLMTAGTLAIALTAPFAGVLADIVGRKRLITAAMFATVVPTLLMMVVQSVPEMVAMRFVQGLLLPPIFTVAVAYIGDEWPSGDVARVAGIYISGTSIGGFCGRFIPGVFADLIGWRAAYGVVGLLTLISAIVVAATLARERRFVPSGGLGNSLRSILKHLRDRLRRAVQFHGDLHLYQLPPCRPALPVHADAARRLVPDLPGVESAGAWGRTRH